MLRFFCLALAALAIAADAAPAGSPPPDPWSSNLPPTPSVDLSLGGVFGYHDPAMPGSSSLIHGEPQRFGTIYHSVSEPSSSTRSEPVLRTFVPTKSQEAELSAPFEREKAPAAQMERARARAAWIEQQKAPAAQMERTRARAAWIEREMRLAARVKAFLGFKVEANQYIKEFVGHWPNGYINKGHYNMKVSMVKKRARSAFDL